MRSVFCILLVLTATSVWAQQKHVLYPMGWRGNRIELHTISDKAKQQSCTFVATADSIRALVFNNQVQLVQQFSIPRKLEEQLLGGFIKDGKVNLYIECDRFDYLRNWELDIATGASADNKIPFELKKEKIIDRISCGDHFLYFTINKNTSEFIIHDFTGENRYSTTRYTLEEDSWKDLTKSSVLWRSINVATIDVEGECSVEAAVHRNKIYARHDTLYLLMNKEKGATHVYSFDMANQKTTRRVIAHQTGDFAAGTSENSYLLKDKLFHIQATDDSLCIEIINFYSGNSIKRFVTGREDPIAFKNTAIETETGELSKTKQLLRKMVNGDAFIIATPDYNDQLQLVVGSYEKGKSFTSMGGGSFMTVGSAGNAVSVYQPSGAMIRNNWTRSARFKMLINVRTGEFISGKIANNINEKIAYYTGGIKIPPEGENLFETNGHYYFAYWETKERRLVILKF